MTEPSFHWPHGFEPRSARLYLRNSRLIRAAPESIWSWLVRAPRWHSWFPNATNVEILDGGTELTMGTHFRWTQTGITLDSTVREYVAHRRLAWYASSPFIKAYHAWDMSPQADGVLVVTDETQRGVLPMLMGRILKPRMLSIHERWLEGLEEQATTGCAP